MIRFDEEWLAAAAERASRMEEGLPFPLAGKPVVRKELEEQEAPETVSPEDVLP